MSRATVRAGIVAWLRNYAPITTVYAQQPALIPESAFWLTSESTVGTVCSVNLASSLEQRRAIGGATNGRKRIDHTIELQIIHRFQQVPGPDADDTIIAAMASFDDVFEQLMASIRSDRTAASTVWEWGETCTSVFGDPHKTASGAVEVFGVLTTTATEWINS